MRKRVWGNIVIVEGNREEGMTGTEEMARGRQGEAEAQDELQLQRSSISVSFNPLPPHPTLSPILPSLPYFLHDRPIRTVSLSGAL